MHNSMQNEYDNKLSEIIGPYTYLLTSLSKVFEKNRPWLIIWSPD